MTQGTVNVLDLDTNAITTIPAGELAEGMLRARMEGIDGEIWVEASKLKSGGPLRHPPFEEDLRDILRRLGQTFADVCPRTLEEWEDELRRDTHPEQEIALWVVMEEVFLHFTSGRSLDEEQKIDIFSVVLACVNNGPEYVLATTSPRTLSRKAVKEIVEYFQERGKL